MLVVDDHPVVRAVVSDLVGHTEGLRVWGTAVSGRDALAQLEASGPGGTARPDGPEVVVTDLRMPGMDGLGLVAEVRSRWPAIPCLVFSAQDRLSSEVSAAAAGAVGFVEKGNPGELIAAVLRVGAVDPEVDGMACRPVPPEFAEWQPLSQLAERVAALLPWTCASRDDGAPWLPTAGIVSRLFTEALAPIPDDWEGRVTEASEHVGLHHLTVSARAPGSDRAQGGGSFYSTARRVVAGQLTPLPPGADTRANDQRGPTRALQTNGQRPSAPQAQLDALGLHDEAERVFRTT